MEEAQTPLLIGPRDILFGYTYLDPVDPPREIKVRYGAPRVRVEYRVEGRLESGDFPLEGLAHNADFLAALRKPELQTIHTQETSLEDIFIRVTGRELV